LREVNVHFDDSVNSILLIGLFNDVVSAEKYLQSMYIEAVCSEKLDLQLPGLVTT